MLIALLALVRPAGAPASAAGTTLRLTATSTPDLPAGSTIELSFGSGSGTIGF